MADNPPRVIEAECPDCGLIVRERAPVDHENNGHCPRCGAEVEGEPDLNVG